MTLAAPSRWQTENQRSLMAEVGWLRGFLERADAGGDDLAEPTGDRCPALDTIRGCFALTPFERRIILLCAAPELDGRFADVLAVAHGDPGRAYPTFGLALAAFDDAHWSALTPAAPLRRWGLVELGPGGVTSGRLRIDEWLLHALTGAGGLDARLLPLLEPISTTDRLTASQTPALEEIVALWSAPAAASGYHPVVLGGPSRASQHAAVAAACERLGWRAYAVGADELPRGAVECDELARVWAREAILSPAALMIDIEHADEPAVRAAVGRLVKRLRTPVVVATRDGSCETGRPSVPIQVGKPTRGEQRALWSAAIGDTSSDAALAAIVGQFDLDAGGISAAAGRAARAGDRKLGRALWEACRITTRADLDGFAQRLDTAATFEDLVLPAPQVDLLRDIRAQVRNRAQVYDGWELGARTARGLGISALFAGPSGTGKTLAAEVLAQSLALDLYRVDLSQVVDKYIGETEKNLRRVFDAADGGGVILLFDEADALFGKRSEVRDSHDRYANLEVSYLLARMESYRGLAILTTNMRGALDPAFMRRLRFVVSFPFPDADQRAAMWARAFPPATPTHGLDPARLARLSVAGGTIRNIAVHAAFFAADDAEPVGMAHLQRAAVVECAKLERPLSDAEIGGWA